MTRKFAVTVLIGGLFSFVGCRNVDDLLTFSINHETEFQVESTSPLGLPLELATPDVTTNSNQSFQNNNTSASLVKDIKLQRVNLSITNPANKTFSFLKSIHVYISTDQHSEILLAHLEEIPQTVSEIELIPTSQKLDAYVKAPSYKVRTRIVTDETLTQPVDVLMDLSFKVTAAPL